MRNDVMPVYRMLGLSMAMLFTVVQCLLLLLALAKALSVVDAGKRFVQELSIVATHGEAHGIEDPAPDIAYLDFSSNRHHRLKLEQGSSPEQA